MTIYADCSYKEMSVGERTHTFAEPHKFILSDLSFAPTSLGMYHTHCFAKQKKTLQQLYPTTDICSSINTLFKI